MRNEIKDVEKKKKSHLKTFNIRKCMVKEWKSLNIISTEGGILTFYLDQAFSRISGQRILLSNGKNRYRQHCISFRQVWNGV